LETSKCSEFRVQSDEGLILVGGLPSRSRALSFDSEFGRVLREYGGDEDFVVCLGLAILVAGEFANGVLSSADLRNLFVCRDGVFGLPVGGAFWGARRELVMRVAIITYTKSATNLTKAHASSCHLFSESPV
jgi:hypothetical protein